MTPKSVNNLLRIALRILEFGAMGIGLPLPDPPLPPYSDLLLAETQRSRYLREGPEQERLLKHCGEDLADLIRFDLEIGLRWSEIASPRWQEIETLEESIRVCVKERRHDPIPQYDLPVGRGARNPGPASRQGAVGIRVHHGGRGQLPLRRHILSEGCGSPSPTTACIASSPWRCI
ncbi:hypothetical protein G6321_00003255 (plasmid) [Bradyrhizobium barranii subsp. barranii]|uniref:Uncharacterized protein n=1 Tax=Bradyrhizobium barranii subsp. barranii TaxID=2823807 RepID=A0A7Z0TWU5_9BRAD|nr:hypothetical protein [Bradyrhizobium barranii]UGX89817.1 hypothetical protein G6321_00003255 [Bradyrhizobium barranii subsp. barranii]